MATSFAGSNFQIGSASNSGGTTGFGVRLAGAAARPVGCGAGACADVCVCGTRRVAFLAAATCWQPAPPCATAHDKPATHAIGFFIFEEHSLGGIPGQLAMPSPLRWRLQRLTHRPRR